MKRHTILTAPFEQDPKTSAAVFEDGVVQTPGAPPVKVTGCVFFVLNKEAIPKIEDDQCHAASKFVREFISELHISSKLRKDVKYDYFMENSMHLCYLVPSFQWPDWKLKTFLKCYVLYQFFDNYLRNESNMEDIEHTFGPNHLTKLLTIVTNIFHGKYGSPQDIPCENNPYIQKAFQLLHNCHTELLNTCFEYPRRSKPLILAIKNCIRQWFILTKSKSPSLENEFTYITVRKVGEFAVTLEIIALIEGIDISDEIRENTMFEIAFTSADLLSFMTQDLITIRRAIENGVKPYLNYALWKVDTDEINLEKSLRTMFHIQKEQTLDYMQFRQTLKDWFENDYGVHQYVILMDWLVDGMIRKALVQKDGLSPVGYEIKDVYCE